MDYSRETAKTYAAEHWRGVCNVIIPSFTSDLKDLNEAGIRHDVRTNIEKGFWGALLVSECGTTMEEYKRFMDICQDEAGGRQHFLIHGTFDTKEEIIEAAKHGEKIGISGILLGHPNSFYPQSNDELYRYIEECVNATELAVCLFVTIQMNLLRLDVSGYPMDVILKAAQLPNVVAVKYEVGRPGIAGDYELYKGLQGTGCLFSDPFEAHSPVTTEYFGMQWMGTSNFEYWGDRVPKYFNLLLDGNYKDAREIYWSMQPARLARMDVQGTVKGGNLIHRYLWKYQAWLQGYNGGRLRQPVMKINDAQVRAVRAGLTNSGFKLKDESMIDFYNGRNPA